MRRFIFFPPIGLAALAAGGCVSLPFAHVQADVRNRLNAKVRWNQSLEADIEAESAIHQLLERPLSADAAVQVALLNNVSLQATFEDLGVAQAEFVQAGLLSNPIFDFTPRWPTKSGLRFSYELNVTQSFLDVFLIPLRKHVAESELDAARLRVTHEVLNLAAKTREAFYRLQAAGQMKELRAIAAQAAQASADAAKLLRQAGNITELALAQEERQAAQAKVDEADAEAMLADRREDLTALMGLWGPDVRFEIEVRLPDPPEQEIPREKLESLAVSHRFDLLAAAQEVEGMRRRLGLSAAQTFPFSIGFYAEKEPEPHGATLLGPTFQIPIPLFDHGQGRVAAAEASLRQAWRRYTALAVEIRSDVRRAHQKLLIARKKAQALRGEVIPIGQRVLEQSVLQHNAMQLGVFDLLRARRDQIDAGRDYVQALEDYWVARAELDAAVGGLPTQTSETLTTQPAIPSNEHAH